MSATAVLKSNLEGKKILITGGLGFVGGNLALRCLELGANVTIYDCLDPHSGGNMYNIYGFEKEIEVLLNDIRNFEGISQCIRGKDIVFTCAAFTSHPNSMKEPLIDVDVNCKGMINILEAARRFNPDVKIVHIGTSTQIGAMRRDVIDEDHPEFPLDIYSANKSASEKYVLIYGNAYGLRTTVVRLANNYGPRSNIKSPDFGFMNYFIGLGLKKKELSVFGDGKQLRNISFIDDSVTALILAAQNEASNKAALFAVADRQYSISEIASAIADVIGGSVRYVEFPRERKVIDIGDAIINNARIKAMLEWQPTWDLHAGLSKTRAYFEPVLDKYLG
jgi:UDP-glucose 4-epimerase